MKAYELELKIQLMDTVIQLLSSQIPSMYARDALHQAIIGRRLMEINLRELHDSEDCPVKGK